MLNRPFKTAFLIGIALIALVLTELAVASKAAAHQQKLALTKLVVNPRTEQLEIMHRFELHDAEHAVKTLFGGSADIMQSVDTQQKFAQYASERFSMYDENDQALALTNVGFEVEGKHFWVYQETEAPDSLQGIKIVHNALRDIWYAQTNTVSIETAEQFETLTFTENTEVLSISFKH